ncbi:hypothetical protein SDC9_166756 [bioreactor metagenome]|uniref:Uncharacterized protein n=1 Tax=bioreactor metagenome TaxID=1076179 RepID=A0A645FXX1_9ZZZZ
MRDAENDFADDFALGLGDAVPGIVDLAQDGQRMRMESAAGRCQFDAAWQALKERLTEFVLQLRQLVAERRLRDVDRAGGLGKAAVFGNGEKVAELAQFHGGAIPCGAASLSRFKMGVSKF